MIRVVNVRGMTTPDLRAGVVYVGRRFAGWSAHALGNPYRHAQNLDALTAYRAWIEEMDPDRLSLLLAELWEATGEGKKPLGCWCVNATAGDGTPEVCHAQILAEMLRERFSCAVGGTLPSDVSEDGRNCG